MLAPTDTAARGDRFFGSSATGILAVACGKTKPPGLGKKFCEPAGRRTVWI
jgi:hypothetical protein